METLVFGCPDTALTIDSGINSNSESLSPVRELQIELTCPHCARQHRFPVNCGRLTSVAWRNGPFPALLRPI